MISYIRMNVKRCLDYFRKEVVGEKKPFQREYRIVPHGDKQVRWVHGLGRLEFNEEGNLFPCLAPFRTSPNGSRRRRHCGRAKMRLRRFYESGLLGVIYWTMNGQIVDANDKFLEMVGYERADLVAGRIDWINMTPPEYRHLDAHSVEELKATGVNKVPFEKEYIRKDGMRVPIIVAGAMLDEARLDGVAFVLDITERKRAEEALKKAHDELERRVGERTAELAKANQELAIFQKFAEASGQGFSMADLDGHLIYLNPALCRMLGEERQDDFIGQHLSICYPEESNRRGRQEIEPVLKQRGYWEGELLMLSRHGKSVPTWQNSFIIRDEREIRFAWPSW